MKIISRTSLYSFLTILFLSIVLVFLSYSYDFSRFSSQKDLKTFIREHFPSLYTKIITTIQEQDQEVPGIGEKLNLPVFKLILSRKDIAHFSNLYKKYEDPQYGEEYYQKHNVWKKAKLQYEGKNYKIKIRSHGRQPNYHRNGKFISYAIKLKKGEQIRNARRFSLIIRERIRLERHLILSLADWFKLIKQQDELIRVKINNWDEKLYYLEHRVDEAFMEAQKMSSFRLVEDTKLNDKSMVLNATHPESPPFDPFTFRERFLNSSSMKKNTLPLPQKSAMLARYLGLNSTIASGNYEDITEFFDLNYISSFEAARTIAGCLGHGLTKSNLFVFLNTANGKIYPVITRDNIPSLLGNSGNYVIEKGINYFGQTSMSLFHLLTANDEIRQEKYKKINDYIKKEQGKTASKHNKLIEQDSKLHYLGIVFQGLRKLGLNIYPDIISYNLNLLQTFLEAANPQVKARYFQRGILLDVQPNSNAAIRFSRLNLKLNVPVHKQSVNVQLKVYAKYSDRIEKIGESGDIVAFANDMLNLSELTKNFAFSNARDEKSELIQRGYLLYFDLSLTDMGNSSLIETIDFAFQNTITGMPIKSAPINIDNVLARSWEEEADQTSSSNLSEFETLKTTNRDIIFSFNEILNEVTIHSGTYKIEHDLILPPKSKLVVEQGTTLLLGEDIVIVGYNGIEINGTAEHPVTITSLSPDKPFGSLGILGDGTSESAIRYLHLSNGRERWYEGAFFSGGLSIHYNRNVKISDSVFSKNYADDGINIKYCSNVVIDNSIFTDNFADQVDLDYCNGAVINSRFIIKDKLDSNGDGLDMSGSQIVVKNSSFYGFKDKGISIGERSDVLLVKNAFSENKNGVAVKDFSKAFFLQNTFLKNTLDINIYQKKSIYGGSIAYLQNTEKKITYQLDKKSFLKEFPDSNLVDEIKKQDDFIKLQNILITDLSQL